MDPDRWREVNSLFSEILALPPADRPARLVALSEGDPEVLAEVEALLRADERAHTSMEPFLDEGTLGGFSEALGEGARIGPYRLIREIGRGGMGHVYLAERSDEFQMRVAIKIVHAGLSESLRVRFQRERQILAGLDHPNIAKLLDGGTTPQGAPYLIMEYVDGETITRFCETRELPTRARLALFETVGEAVHHAHRHLVIHRDLKPANILVTKEGIPKLLDFGIAKLLETDGTGGGHTLTGFQPMTPAYASPEQASGGAITTASDVYSLGVILFELVCGSRPYDFSSATPLEVRQKLLETTPVPPSRVKSGVSKDIDSIVSMAMRKEPERRYVSAAALVDDIRRHLGSFPIVARPETLAYQVGRFVRRNRGMVIAASVASLALFAASAVALWQAREARAQRALSERRFAEARKIANSMVLELHAEIGNIPGATKARNMLLGRASEWLDTLARDAPDDPALAAELAEAYSQLGGAQGGAAEASAGDRDAALASQRKSLALREKLVALAPDNPDYADRLASALITMSYAEPPGPGMGFARQAVTLSQRLASETPGNVQRKARLGRAHYAEGSIRVSTGDLRGAEGVFQKAAEIFEAVLVSDPTNVNSPRNVSLVNKRLGAIANKEGRTARAVEHYERALATDLDLAARDPTNVQARYDLTVSYVEVAGVKMAGHDPKGARDEYRKALAIREELLRLDPANAFARDTLISLLIQLAAADEEIGDHQAAMASLVRADGVFRDNKAGLRSGFLSGRAAVRRSLGQTQEALEDSRDAVDFFRASLKAAPGNVLAAEPLALELLRLGELLAASGAAKGRREACGLYAEAAEVVRQFEHQPQETLPSIASLSAAIRKALAGCN